ncbi:MAG: YiiD C-terminal domain-containing protein [Mariprofundus sp.]
MKISDLPFNQTIGLQVDGDSVFISQQDHLLNHVGSLHASVIHGLAEGASGHFLILNLLPLFPESLVLAKKAVIQYRRPASGDCRACAEVSEVALQTCIVTLRRRNRAVLAVPVHVYCKGHIIASAEFDWWLRLER